jgi:GTP-dependent phosphoenolpyruvate carboxykinase
LALVGTRGEGRLGRRESSDSERERETERQRDRETERQRDRETERARETKSFVVTIVKGRMKGERLFVIWSCVGIRMMPP